jgi:hypothetical protein
VWWVRRAPLPADLITTGSPADHIPGALGQPNTQAVFATPGTEFPTAAGARVLAGFWVDDHHVFGLDGSAFVLGRQRFGFDVNSRSTGAPLLAFRHLDPSGAEDAFPITAPVVKGATVGPFTGGAGFLTDTHLWGADGSAVHALYWSPGFRVVLATGLRYLDLTENLTIQSRKVATGSSSVTFLGSRFAAPAFTLTDDSFHAHDQFLGGQVGLRVEWFYRQLFLGASASAAVGRSDDSSGVLGLSTLQPRNAPPQTAAGGLYALPTNSGHFTDGEWGVVPEVQLRAGYQATPWLRVTVGYEFLYWSRVVRPGDQLDLVVDAHQVPTDPSYKAGTPVTFPRPLFQTSGFWAHGLICGLEITY